MHKTIKNIAYSLALFAVLGLLGASTGFSQPKGASAPTCEKCFRGPDGKIKCEKVPCPK